MKQEKIFTDKAPHISIAECNGELVVRSWAETAVSLKGNNFDVNESEGKLSISSQGSLKLTVPIRTTLSITYVNGDVAIKLVEGDIDLIEVNGDAILRGLNSVHVQTLNGDLSAKNLDGVLTLTMVSGDANLRNIGGLTVQTIQGDLAARNVNGDVEMQQAQGDVSLRTVNGNVTIKNGQRDVNLHNLGGLVDIQGIQGDIRLRGGLSQGDHTFTAERDIIVRWPLTSPLNLTATAPSIKNRLPLEKETEMENTLIGRIGDGETNASFTANGRIILREGEMVNPKWHDDSSFEADFDFDFSTFGNQISQQVNEQVARISQRLESTMGPDFAQGLAEKITRKVEKATARAEKAGERARQRAERQRQRVPRAARPTATREPKQKASNEEHLKILKMVEQGTISPDEAATLLEALEK
jgi:SHOCT-like domain